MSKIIVDSAAEQLRDVARRREELARAYQRKAERYKDQAREMRLVASRLIRENSGGK